MHAYIHKDRQPASQAGRQADTDVSLDESVTADYTTMYVKILMKTLVHNKHIQYRQIGSQKIKLGLTR